MGKRHVGAQNLPHGARAGWVFSRLRIRDELQEEFALTLEDINKLKMTILVILDSIKEDLSVYVTKEYYLSAMATEKASYEQLKELELAKLFKGIEEQFTKTA